MRSASRVLASIALLCASVGGCSSDTEEPFPTVGAFCEARAQKECLVAARCAATTDACRLARQSSCLIEASRIERSRTYTPANAPGCLDRVQKAYEKGILKVSDQAGVDSMRDVCERVFTGNGTVSQPCSTDYDCQSSLICAPSTPGATTRICATLVIKKESEPCFDAGGICDTGTYCALLPQGGARCKQRPVESQTCDEQTPCREDLRCSQNICTMRALAGESCASNNDCDESAPFCDASAGNICTEGISFAPNSPACTGYGR